MPIAVKARRTILAPYLPALAASIAAANDETKRSSLETLRNQASGHTAAALPSSVMNSWGHTVKGATPSVIQVPDWTIFDHAFANEPTRLTTSEFVDRVRTSSAALTPDSAETTGQVSVR